MLRKLLPHPLLTVFMTVVWLLLVNDFSMGHLVLGLILGILIPIYTSAFWPDRPQIRRPLRVVEYVLVVSLDILVANVQVAWLILTRKNDEFIPHFLVIPLEVRSPEAITTLAGTITMTPGTVSCDVAADGRSLLVHGLNVPDPEADIARIKSRYEARLKEIFG